MELYEQNIYLAPYSHLIGKVITEYDIKKANISMLYWKGIISKDEYNRLYNLDKSIREKVIGKMIRDDKSIYKVIKNGIIEAKEMLFRYNHILREEVLSIKNDAVFIINKKAKNNIFQVSNDLAIEFVDKNVYSSFYNFKIRGVLSQEIYYLYDEINGTEVIDVKGIKDERLKYHEGYFLDFLTDVFYTAQCKSLTDSIRIIERYYMDYINGKLDINNYRKFDSRSCFETSTTFSKFESILPLPYDILNTEYNLHIIRLLYKMISKDILLGIKR